MSTTGQGQHLPFHVMMPQDLTASRARGLSSLPLAQRLLSTAACHLTNVCSDPRNDYYDSRPITLPALEPGLDLLAQTATVPRSGRRGDTLARIRCPSSGLCTQRILETTAQRRDNAAVLNTDEPYHGEREQYTGDNSTSYSNSSTWTQKNAVDGTEESMPWEKRRSDFPSVAQNSCGEFQPLAIPNSPLSLNYAGNGRSESNLPVFSKTRKRRREIPGKKGPWTEMEDSVLQGLVALYGPRKWGDIARPIEGRTGKQARERWMNQLAPQLKKNVKWNEEEDRAVVLRQAEFGNRWSKIATYLSGRTDNHVKNRFNSTLKRKKDEGFYDSWLLSKGLARRELFYPYTSTFPAPRPTVELNDMVRIPVPHSTSLPSTSRQRTYSKCELMSCQEHRIDAEKSYKLSPASVESMSLNNQGLTKASDEPSSKFQCEHGAYTVAKRISVGSLCNS
jgi:hypothetical protein